MAAILGECAGDIVVEPQLAIREDRGAVAILPDRAAVMGDEDDVGALHPLAKGQRAFATKPLVASLGDLVDQVGVEIDREARAESESSTHAGRIRIDRHIEIRPELGEIGDVADGLLQSRAINARDKGDVLAARQCGIRAQMGPGARNFARIRPSLKRKAAVR